MTYTLDPELEGVLAALTRRATAGPRPARGDWKLLRELGEAGQAYMAGLVPPSSGVQTATHQMGTKDGASIELRWYTQREPPESARRPSGTAAVVYAHGGGMVMGTLDLYDEVVSWYVAQTGVPFLSVGYRRAPDEGTGVKLAEDIFGALTWLLEHSSAMGVDPARIAVMGDSGGGALAAGAAILARDQQVPLARQILVYPMLDDRNQVTDPPPPSAYVTWNYDNNYTAWQAVLGVQLGAEDVPPVAAPARLSDFAGLAPAYLDVGDLDILRTEGIFYALRLASAGVPIELHVHPGVPHGWERFAPHSDSGRRAMNDRARAVKALNR